MTNSYHRHFSAGLFTIFAACAGSTEHPDLAVAEPATVFPYEFGLVSGFRSFQDGRIMIGDPLGQALVLLDPSAGTLDTLGRVGAGPGEYQQPDALFAMTGDTTLLLDLGNARLTVVHPDRSFGRSMPIVQGGGQGPGGMSVLLPRGRDAQGRLYHQPLGIAQPGSGLPDSASVIRYDPGTGTADTVGTVKLSERRQQNVGDNFRISTVPLSPQDEWAVGADGRVAFARAAGYIEWVDADGGVTRGPTLDDPPVPITTAEKQEFVDNAGVGGLTIQMSFGASGGPNASFGRGGGRGNRSIDDYEEWAEVKPPFVNNRTIVSPAGEVWAMRSAPAGGNTRYDIFDRKGARTGSFVTGPRRRIVGFGVDKVYMAFRDEFDLEYLEAYPMPGGRG